MVRKMGGENLDHVLCKWLHQMAWKHVSEWGGKQNNFADMFKFVTKWPETKAPATVCLGQWKAILLNVFCSSHWYQRSFCRSGLKVKAQMLALVAAWPPGRCRGPLTKLDLVQRLNRGQVRVSNTCILGMLIAVALNCQKRKEKKSSHES